MLSLNLSDPSPMGGARRLGQQIPRLDPPSYPAVPEPVTREITGKTYRPWSGHQRYAVSTIYQVTRLVRTVITLERAGIAASKLAVMADRVLARRRLRPYLSWLGQGDCTLSLHELLTGLDEDTDETLFVTPGPLSRRLQLSDDWRFRRLRCRICALLPVESWARLNAAIDEGAALLWVNVQDDSEEPGVCEFLLRYSDEDLQIHDL